MPDDSQLTWKQQLDRLRDRVVELEKQREIRKRVQREQSEKALQKRLKEDTAEVLTARFKTLRERFEHDARKFYPVPWLKQISSELEEFRDLLNFYAEGLRQYPNVFTANHKVTIPRLLREAEDMGKSLQRQLRQWAAVGDFVEDVRFRPRKPQDDPVLVAVAKAFSERAHQMELTIPGDYFAQETENFWTVERAGQILGYIKYSPDLQTISFALADQPNLNYTKFIRGVLHRFYAEGPLPQKPDRIRVRLSYHREVKFYTDLGFVRTEVRGPSDWIYERHPG